MAIPAPTLGSMNTIPAPLSETDTRDETQRALDQYREIHGT